MRENIHKASWDANFFWKQEDFTRMWKHVMVLSNSFSKGKHSIPDPADVVAASTGRGVSPIYLIPSIIVKYHGGSGLSFAKFENRWYLSPYWINWPHPFTFNVALSMPLATPSINVDVVGRNCRCNKNISPPAFNSALHKTGDWLALAAVVFRHNGRRC